MTKKHVCHFTNPAETNTKRNQKESSDQLSVRADEQSSSGADDDDEVIAEAVRSAEQQGREAAAAAGHQRRAIQFGRWTISPVYTGGIHTAWGANCGSHFGSHLNCKKVFTGVGEQGLSEARCLAKAWLLAGQEISAAARNGRQDHVFGAAFQRDTLVVEPEATLDERASAT